MASLTHKVTFVDLFQKSFHNLNGLREMRSVLKTPPNSVQVHHFLFFRQLLLFCMDGQCSSASRKKLQQCFLYFEILTAYLKKIYFFVMKNQLQSVFGYFWQPACFGLLLCYFKTKYQLNLPLFARRNTKLLFDHVKTIVGQHPRIMDDSIILLIMVL